MQQRLDRVTEEVRQTLERLLGERNTLLEAVTQRLERDTRIAAAWLFGSLGRGEGDALSDLDLFVVVRDADFDEMVGSVSARKVFIRQAGGDPIVFGEAPQNAPPQGAYAGILYAGEVSPHRADWYWQPQSMAVLPQSDAAVLFDRVGIRRSEAPVSWEYQPIPEESIEEEASRACSGFWAMLLITAKYVARTPREDGMGLLKWAYVSLNQMERFLWLEPTAEEGMPSTEAADGRTEDYTDPHIKLALLRRLTARMQDLSPLLAARGVLLPDGKIVSQSYRYLDLLERTCVGRDETGSAGARLP
ncbi:MAG: nucleotidyltransferase domain-containing protein [Armatimonadota bacterium]